MEQEKKGIRLTWKLKDPPEGAVAAWGARAIATHQELDLPYDRQDFQSGPLTEEARASFASWINKKGIPHVKKALKGIHWNLGSSEVFEMQDGNRHITASCNSSYGYCYITAWETAEQKKEAVHD